MADIPSSRAKINDIEVGADAPVTEALVNKFGANVNDYLDKELNYLEILASTTWTAPDNVNWVIIEACGGGAGGAGTFAGGGGGGGGAPIIRTPCKVTPGNVYTVTIGAGGAGGAAGFGGGADGSNTTFIGADANLIFRGGERPNATTSYTNNAFLSGVLTNQSFGGRSILGSAHGGDANLTSNLVPAAKSSGSSIYASGGLHPTFQNGGGGGAAFGPGGDAADNSNGGSAAANSGAGGAGGASGGSYAGGAGGSGRLRLYWYGNA